jgi:phospholipase C
MIGYPTRGQPAHSFRSLGPRVPAVIVSPLVEAGSACNTLFDHTSVLQFLAELFTPGTPYSPEVEERRKQGIGSLSVALDDSVRTDVPKVPADPIRVESALGGGVALRPSNGLQASFELAASELMVCNPVLTGKKYPDLFHWKAAVDAERRQVLGIPAAAPSSATPRRRRRSR